MILKGWSQINIGVTKEVVRNENSQNSQFQTRPTEIQTLWEWAQEFVFNKFSWWFWCILKVKTVAFWTDVTLCDIVESTHAFYLDWVRKEDFSKELTFKSRSESQENPQWFQTEGTKRTKSLCWEWALHIWRAEMLVCLKHSQGEEWFKLWKVV